MILVTGATGKLGQHVVAQLLARVPAQRVAVAVRNPAAVPAGWQAEGVGVREADYTRPEMWVRALQGIDQVLLISANEVGKRAAQHQVVIDAARAAGVKQFVYTSILHAARSRLALAEEHRATEAAIRAAELPFTLLRNGWYLENYTENLAPVLVHRAVVGAAGEGRVAAAARADYAAAAVEVLTTPGHLNAIYELAGDTAFSLRELAAVIGDVTGNAIAYQSLPASAYQAMLEQVGLPAPFAAVLADADIGLGLGDLDNASQTLARLIGRPTTPLRDAVVAALAALPRAGV